MARTSPSACVLCLVGCLLLPSPARAEPDMVVRAEPDMARVERALAGTGFGVDTLLRRHARAAQGGLSSPAQGGPFIPAPPRQGFDGDRWDRLQRALAVLPLASPLANYEVTSGFGRRRDPINRRRAIHAGIDLRAPLRAAVVATAPGRVVFAGRRGGYGRMVEIDHGLGVHTRYAHLSRIAVRVGQNLGLGGRVGLLGNSGRTTGPHLHYEVVVDGRARNPQPFLKAGLRLGRGGRHTG